MTLIGLEGVDGSGKSTLSDAIADELRRRYPGEEVEQLHYSQLEGDPFDEYALKFEAYWPGSGKHIICDRWHWGETIYGPLYRDESALDTAGFRWIELFLKARGATVWHVTASLDTVQERLLTRGEDYLESHHVQRVWEGFANVSQRSLTCGGTADTRKYDAEYLAKLIVNQAVYSEQQAALVFRPELIGRDSSSVLLVGDKQGNGDPGATAAPFMPRGTSSGRFLLAALPELWWHRVAIVNANETDLAKLIEDLMLPTVVALGRNASDALLDIDCEHAAVPHPSYVRRFHSKRLEDYGALIRSVSQTGDVKLSWPN